MKCDRNRWRGFYFQAKKDSSRYKSHLFSFYVRKQKPIFFLYRIAEQFGKGLCGQIAGLLFYLITYIFIRFPHDRKCISMLKLNTEKSSYRDIFGGHSSELNLIRHSFLISILSVVVLMRQFSFQKTAKDFLVLKRILNQFDLYVAFRAIQYLAYYDRFDRELDKKNTNMIIIFTDANPHGTALLHLARKRDIKICLISRGGPNEPVLPIRCDVAFLVGERSLKRYENGKSHFGRVVYYGHLEMLERIRTVDEKKGVKIGIFLSKSTCLEAVLKLIDLLEKKFEYESVLIRRHPNMELTKEETKTIAKLHKVQISDGSSLGADIKKCDFVFAGNTTVHVDVLLRGRPSLYYRSLEKDFFDRCGYVREGVILEWDQGVSIDEINTFYKNLNEQNRINYYLNTENDSRGSIREFKEIVFGNHL